MNRLGTIFTQYDNVVLPNLCQKSLSSTLPIRSNNAGGGDGVDDDVRPTLANSYVTEIVKNSGEKEGA